MVDKMLLDIIIDVLLIYNLCSIPEAAPYEIKTAYILVTYIVITYPDTVITVHIITKYLAPRYGRRIPHMNAAIELIFTLCIYIYIEILHYLIKIFKCKDILTN